MDIIARQSLEKEVQSMSHYLDELLDPQKVSETKGSTLKNQLKVYREVEDKTKMLSELLQFRSDALTDKLAKLRQRCLNVLDEISTNPAVASPEEEITSTEESISELEEKNLTPATTDESPDNLFDLGF
jgi:chromosome segregation ATPase